MGADFVTQEQLNLRLNQLRYEFGVAVDKTVSERVQAAIQPLEARLDLFAQNAEKALSKVMELSAEAKASTDSRYHEIAEINENIRAISRDAALAFTGYGLIGEQLRGINSSIEKRYEATQAQIKTLQSWQERRSAWERGIVNIVRLIMPTAKVIIISILTALAGGLLGVFWTLISQLWR